MNAKVIIAAVIGGVASFLLGWLIWGMLLMDIMAQYQNASCMKPESEMNMGLLIVANLLWGFLYAYIFSNWKGELSFKAGLVPGALMSVLIGLSFDLYTITFTTMSNSYTPIGINFVANAVVGAIIGGVVTWWLSRE